ncbi:MAG: hypothetical protein AB1638_11340 [Nitrospirota bacterium]
MRKVKYLFRNINLINTILIIAIILFANYAILPVFNMSIKYSVPAIKKTKSDIEEKSAESSLPSLADFTMIAEDNLFHPERKIPLEKPAAPPLPKPEFVLYGTLITDDTSLAYLEDLKAPYSTPGRGKRQTALKKGDSMSGFILKDIEVDKIVMVRGEEKIEVYLNDTQRPKTRKEAGIATITPPQQSQPRVLPTSPMKDQRSAVTGSSEGTTSSLHTDIKKQHLPAPEGGKGGRGLLRGMRK